MVANLSVIPMIAWQTGGFGLLEFLWNIVTLVPSFAGIVHTTLLVSPLP